MPTENYTSETSWMFTSIVTAIEENDLSIPVNTTAGASYGPTRVFGRKRWVFTMERIVKTEAGAYHATSVGDSVDSISAFYGGVSLIYTASGADFYCTADNAEPLEPGADMVRDVMTWQIIGPWDVTLENGNPTIGPSEPEE